MWPVNVQVQQNRRRRSIRWNEDGNWNERNTHMYLKFQDIFADPRGSSQVMALQLKNETRVLIPNVCIACVCECVCSAHTWQSHSGENIHICWCCSRSWCYFLNALFLDSPQRRRWGGKLKTSLFVGYEYIVLEKQRKYIYSSTSNCFDKATILSIL